jgi:AcrR family transcriptional regulator
VKTITTSMDPISSEEDLRAALIGAAEAQLRESSDNDIATRAVCEAVGVSQPVLYRLFRDKRGLLDALADDGLRRYGDQKAMLEQSGDPLDDLRAGWDHHMAFARSNPSLYQLMFAPRPRSHAQARKKILDLLEATLLRVSGIGALRVSPRVAAQLVLTANIGLALSLIAEPELFDVPGLSHRSRDAVFGAVLTEPAATGEHHPVPAAAMRLRSQLQVSGAEPLEPAEAALLDRWLERLATGL